MGNNAGYGVVYTPDSLAEYTSTLLIEEFCKDLAAGVKKENFIVLDPACGEGALLAAAEKVIYSHRDNLHPKFVGIDVEEDVIESNRTAFDCSQYIFYLNDALVPTEKMLPANYWKAAGVKPTLIIANPPWSSEKLYDRKRLSDAGYKFDVGQYDSYVLFVELCLKLIKQDGYMALIIPDSIFSGENRDLRRYLAERTQLRVISRLGEKIFPGVNRATTVMIIKNSAPLDSSKTTCFRLTTDLRKQYFSGETTLLESHKQNAHIVLQKRFRENPGYVFDIDTRANEEGLLRKMEMEAIKWEEVFHFGRGVEISKSGVVVTCPNCGMAQGYSKKQYKSGQKKCTRCGKTIEISQKTSSKIVDAIYHSGYKKIYVGENLHRYALVGSNFIKMNVPGINYKEEKLYEPPKILIRKTGLGINACIDDDSTYISQTVYSCNFLHADHSVPLEYYLGVLNSRILYYYYLKKYGENEWKSHPYLTKDIIFSFPIPKATEKNLHICNDIAEKVIAIEKAYSRELDFEIEQLVAALYGLEDYELGIIRDTLNQLPNLGAINHMKINEGELCSDI